MICSLRDLFPTTPLHIINPVRTDLVVPLPLLIKLRHYTPQIGIRLYQPVVAIFECAD